MKNTINHTITRWVIVGAMFVFAVIALVVPVSSASAQAVTPEQIRAMWVDIRAEGSAMRAAFLAVVPPEVQEAYWTALSSDTSADELILLASHNDFFVRRTVAANNNTPVATLRNLAVDPVDYVRGEVARNENTPIDLLKILVSDSDVLVRRMLVENESAAAQKHGILYKLAQATKDATDWNSVYILNIVASRPTVRSKTLKLLVGHSNYYVRFGIARNKHASPKVLHKLVDDTDRRVREALAQNESTSILTLWDLSKDTDDAVASFAQQHKKYLQKLSLAELEQVLVFMNTGSRKSAENSSKYREFIVALTEDEDEEVREAANKQLEKWDKENAAK